MQKIVSELSRRSVELNSSDTCADAHLMRNAMSCINSLAMAVESCSKYFKHSSSTSLSSPDPSRNAVAISVRRSLKQEAADSTQAALEMIGTLDVYPECLYCDEMNSEAGRLESLLAKSVKQRDEANAETLRLRQFIEEISEICEDTNGRQVARRIRKKIGEREGLLRGTP